METEQILDELLLQLRTYIYTKDCNREFAIKNVQKVEDYIHDHYDDTTGFIQNIILDELKGTGCSKCCKNTTCDNCDRYPVHIVLQRRFRFSCSNGKHLCLKCWKKSKTKQK